LLPVSGLSLIVDEPTGEEELFVLETALAAPAAMVALCRLVARGADGAAIDWDSLAAVELDAASLIIRRAWLGDAIGTDVACPGLGCGERIAVSFSIAEYLNHHRPHRARGVLADEDPGWFRLTGADVRFRIPTLADQFAACTGPAPAQTLTDRCIESRQLSRSLARRLDRAFSALAPRLDGLVGGVCPDCGETVTMRFDPTGYTLAELRTAFSGLYAEVHAIATAHGWSEADILALPHLRRRRYAAMAGGAGIAA
jgi:hypothetical protein